MSSSFAWKPEYSVGVQLIDEQHKMFVSITNELYVAIQGKKGDVVVKDILNQLIAYTQFHFQTEERYFDEFDYEGSAEHKAAHQALIKQVTDLQRRETEITEDPFKLMDFLEDWLIEHIMGMDKLYGPCFNQHGLK